MFPTSCNCVKLVLNAQYMALTFTERKDNQASNKLNTIAIPLAATPLCMVANIVLALSLWVIFPQILFTSLSVLIKLYYIRYTIISTSLVEGGA